MPQYILLLHEPENAWMELSPAEMQAVIEKYGNWSQSLAQRGHLRGGEKLADGTGRVLRRNSNGLTVHDGPYVESKEVIGGYFVLEAASYDEARALASDCPHLDFGAIEIREIEKV